MNEKKKMTKGLYGYRRHRRKKQVTYILIGAALILLQLLIRAVTDHSTLKIILTVSAIVSVLPVANLGSPLLAAWRFKTPSEAFHERAAAYEPAMTLLYDLIITSTESIMPMDVIAVHPTGVFAYCSLAKVNTGKAEKFLKEMFKTHKLDPNVKVITDENIFFRRIDSLKASSEYEDDGSVDYTCNLLKNLSM